MELARERVTWDERYWLNKKKSVKKNLRYAIAVKVQYRCDMIIAVNFGDWSLVVVMMLPAYQAHHHKEKPLFIGNTHVSVGGIFKVF